MCGHSSIKDLLNLESKLDITPRITPLCLILSRVGTRSGNSSQVLLPEKSLYKSELILFIIPLKINIKMCFHTLYLN